MTGYDWAKQAARLERENADLRRQLDDAWERINLVYRHAAELGVELGEAKLREHALELRAITYANEEKAHDLDGFRQNVVMILHSAEDALRAGAEPGSVHAAAQKEILRANDRAKSRSYLAEAREHARRDIDAALAAEPPTTLFDVKEPAA